MPNDFSAIDRRRGLSPVEFQREYASRGRPVILEDASRDWRAHQVLTPAWLRETYGKKLFPVGDKIYSVGELLDILEHTPPGEPTPYPCTMHIREDWPELLPLLDPLPLGHARPNRLDNPLYMSRKFGSRTEVFLGGAGGNFPYAHTDYYHLHAWITMIFGRKEFWVFATDRNEYMYPEPPDYWRSSVPNVFDPDYEKYPLMRNVRAIRAELGPGETLFIPAGTWHSARSLSLTMSVAFDQLNAMNMPAFKRDVWTYHERPMTHRLAYTGYFTVLDWLTRVGERIAIGR